MLRETKHPVWTPRPVWRTSIRGRILVAYVLLLVVFAFATILTIRHVLLLQLEKRVDEQLSQEVLEFNRLLDAGRDPQTGRAFTSVRALFDLYFAQNVPGDEEALAAFIGRATYRTELVRFPLNRLPDEFSSRRFTASTDLPGPGEGLSGVFSTALGDGRYRAVTVLVGAEVGTFMVAILPAAELREIRNAQSTGIWVIAVLLLLATGCVWFIAGRVLAPVRQLTETAQLISRSDLSKRIPVSGTGETVEMAGAFNEMLDRLEAVFRGEREFVRDASHELRVPLTVTLGHLAVLDGTPQDRLRTVALVTDELERMGRIVDDLRLFAEVEHPDFLHPEQIDLAGLPGELATKASALAPRQWTVDAAANGVVVADRHRLTEAVMNLAHNAAQHTAEHDTIAFGTAIDDDTVLIWVRDTGSGIPVGDQVRIFDRFRRGSRAYRRYRGSGLGLAIVKTIAEAHSGRVTLDSGVGLGSTFTIRLPRVPVQEAADGPNSHR